MKNEKMLGRILRNMSDSYEVILTENYWDNNKANR